jgi:HlyD family secretion protein
MVARKRRVPWGWVTVVVLAIGGGGYAFWQQRANAGKPQELPKGVQIGRVELGTLDQKVTATGVVAAQIGAKVNIGSQVSGRVRELPFDVGKQVRKGEIVAVIDSPDLEAQVQQEQQNVGVATANLDQAKSRLRQAGLNYGYSEEQTRAQIDEASYALKAAGERLKMSEATAQMQPTQTSSEIARAKAALNTARSQERQVKQTVNLQIVQAQTNVDDAKAALDRNGTLLKRQTALVSQGYISLQEVDDTRAAQKQLKARYDSAQASLDITREKTDADLQAAHDQVLQAEATVRAAEIGRFQDEMRLAEVRNAAETVRQAEASLTLRRTNRTLDQMRRQEITESRFAVAQAAANLRQSQARLRYQQANLAKAVIRSPIGGTVLTVNTQRGETVASAFQVATLISVADLSRLEVRAYVDETDIGRVRIGLPAEVRVESFQDRLFHGHVVKAASGSTIKDNVVTYETTIQIDDANGLLRPDMTADVTLVLGRKQNVLTLPSEAVHREMTRTVVYVLHPEKKDKERVETRPVQVGWDDGSHAEVISGLKEGEQVVLAGLQRLGVQAADAQQQGPGNQKQRNR